MIWILVCGLYLRLMSTSHNTLTLDTTYTYNSTIPFVYTYVHVSDDCVCGSDLNIDGPSNFVYFALFNFEKCSHPIKPNFTIADPI